MFNSKLLNNIIMCLCIYLASRRMIFQSNWTSFERRKSPLPCLYSLFLMAVDTHTLTRLFLILPAEMKINLGWKISYVLFAFHTQISCFIFSPIGSAGSPPVRGNSAARSPLPSQHCQRRSSGGAQSSGWAAVWIFIFNSSNNRRYFKTMCETKWH